MRKVDLRGMGGSEKEIAKLFPKLVRVDAVLYDFVDPTTGTRYEIKKTANPKLQSWIDPTKYINLSQEDRNIVFRFVYYDKNTGRCKEYVDTSLGEIVDRFVPKEVLSSAKKLLKLFPRRGLFQFKLSIKFR